MTVNESELDPTANPNPTSNPNSQSPLKPTIGKRILRQLRNVAIGYLIVVIMLAFFQRKLIYVPSVEADMSAARLGSAAGSVDDVVTQTDDGLTLNGWHWKSEPTETHDLTDGRPVVLFFHGNGGHRLHRFDDCQLLTSQSADAVIFDYRGYGDNKGKPSEAGLTKDAQAAWRFLTEEKNVNPGRVILFGESLGGGVAVQLAHDLCKKGTPPGGLVLRSTFTSLTDAGSYHFPWLPVRTVLIDRFPSIDLIGQVTCPVLVIHGDQDSIVPYALGQQLFKAANEQSKKGVAKRFVTIRGANHNDVLQVGAPQVKQAIGEFLKAIR